MNMKHTPGPWYWDSEGLGSKDVLVFGKGYPFEMTSKANKQLIAAAPDLLEALQDALHAYDKHGEHPEWDFARAAISKALGEE
ncbi:hypothetical protein [Enterobacter sp. UPMP2052]